jgi:ABC-type uncharacterized transport system substrate-binding protein
VRSSIRLMRQIFPESETIGIIWNPAEACSEACTEMARDAADEFGFELTEATVSSTGEVADALNLMLSKEVDIFLTSGDNTVMMTVESIAQKLREKKIPYFTNSFLDVDRGAFISVGADYYEVGRETGKVAERVIRGTPPKDIPIHSFVPEKIYLNMELAREFGVEIPDSIKKAAAKIKGETK